MKEEVRFADDCEFISNHNNEVLDDLLTELFVDFVNNLVGEEILEIKL